MTRMVNVVEDWEVVGMKVLKKPPSNGWHGSLKELCVTEWFWLELVMWLGKVKESEGDVPLGRR